MCRTTDYPPYEDTVVAEPFKRWQNTIGMSVVDLIALIADKEENQIREIRIKTDPANVTHLVVMAFVGYSFEYAIYINKQTGRTETDGY